MIVRRGATSQWKRSRCDRPPIEPASAPPAQTCGMAARCPSTSARSTSGAKAFSRSRSSSMRAPRNAAVDEKRSEEHTSELQSRGHLVCRLLLEKKKLVTLCYLSFAHEPSWTVYYLEIMPPC